MSDVTELYQRSSTLQDFKKIVRESAVYWKARPDDIYLDALAVKMHEHLGPYPDKLKDAIRVCVNNQSTFPSVKDLQDAAAVVRKKPIDFIATKSIDSRLKPCKLCETRHGYVRMVKGDLDYMAFCSCALGHSLEGQFSGRGIVSKTQLENDGFVRAGRRIK